MYRDFSESSKQKFLGLVSEVENEKICDFTDWVGDRWYDFESWIGRLNIRNYLNDVNTYHRKVLDKNNTTKEQIEKIFDNVASVDMSYRSTFSNDKELLIRWLKYIAQMDQIVNPVNGRFNADDMQAVLIESLSDINGIYLESLSDINNIELILDKGSSAGDDLKAAGSLFKIFSILAKDDNFRLGELQSFDKNTSAKLGLGSSALSYFSGLHAFYNTDYKNTGDVICGVLKLLKVSGSAWTGLYKYYDKTLNAWQAGRLGKRFQKKAGVVSIVGNICGFSSDLITTIEMWKDSNIETSEKIAQTLRNTLSGLGVGEAAAELKWGQKVLTRDVTAKYLWGTPVKNNKMLGRVTNFIAVAKVFIETGIGGVERYAKVTEDGVFDLNDIAEVGLFSGISGLSAVADGLTFGVYGLACDILSYLTDGKLGAEEINNYIGEAIIDIAETDIVGYVLDHKLSSDYVRRVRPLRDFADNPNENLYLRLQAAGVLGTGMLATLGVDGILDGITAGTFNETIEDGTFDREDMVKVGVAAVVRSIMPYAPPSVVNNISCQISDGMIDSAYEKGKAYAARHNNPSNYMRSVQLLADYANNKENNILLRAQASSAAQVGMIGAMAVDGMANSISWVKKRISSRWNVVQNWL